MKDNYQTFYDMFSAKYKKCRTKKQYKKLCKAMLRQFDVLDSVDRHHAEVLAQLIGEEEYFATIALAIRMYILDQQGIPYDVVSLTEDVNKFEF